MKGKEKKFLMLCGVVACGLLAVMAMAGLESFREYKHMRSCEVAAQEHCAQLQATLEEHEHYLNVLLNDPACTERIARQRLGYVGPKEFVFYFEE